MIMTLQDLVTVLKISVLLYIKRYHLLQYVLFWVTKLFCFDYDITKTCDCLEDQCAPLHQTVIFTSMCFDYNFIKTCTCLNMFRLRKTLQNLAIVLKINALLCIEQK
jgi:hypothetical protein